MTSVALRRGPPSAHRGPRPKRPDLNSVVVFNEQALAEAASGQSAAAQGTVWSAGRYPVHRQGQLPGHGLTAASGSARFRQPRRTGTPSRSNNPPRWSDPDRADQYAADGQWRDAARTVRACRVPITQSIDLGLRVPGRRTAPEPRRRPVSPRSGWGETWSTVGPRRPITRCAPTHHAGDLGARQLAAGADDGCGCAAYPNHGRHVRGARMSNVADDP